MKNLASSPVREQITPESRLRPPKRCLGYSSLTDDEREVLSWSAERRLQEFQKANDGIEAQVLENKLLYFDTLIIDNGEIFDNLGLDPTLTWENIRDMFLSGPVDSYASTFHGLSDIKYPEHFWKAIVENERERLITPRPSSA